MEELSWSRKCLPTRRQLAGEAAVGHLTVTTIAVETVAEKKGVRYGGEGWAWKQSEVGGVQVSI